MSEYHVSHQPTYRPIYFSYVYLHQDTGFISQGSKKNTKEAKILKNNASRSLIHAVNIENVQTLKQTITKIHYIWTSSNISIIGRKKEICQKQQTDDKRFG